MFKKIVRELKILRHQIQLHFSELLPSIPELILYIHDMPDGTVRSR